MACKYLKGNLLKLPEYVALKLEYMCHQNNNSCYCNDIVTAIFEYNKFK